ncbi:hypothetical protein BJV77DRAFT_381155 [Russula vinacea]|nr:hypothetical protein BJV77DRAFT_381155 [Russula vinacea]
MFQRHQDQARLYDILAWNTHSPSRPLEIDKDYPILASDPCSCQCDWHSVVCTIRTLSHHKCCYSRALRRMLKTTPDNEYTVIVDRVPLPFQGRSSTDEEHRRTNTGVHATEMAGDLDDEMCRNCVRGNLKEDCLGRVEFCTIRVTSQSKFRVDLDF